MKLKEKVIILIVIAIIFLITSVNVVFAPYPTGYTLGTTGTATSELSTEQYHSPNNAVKMATVTTTDRGEILFSGGPTLSSLSALSYWTYTVHGGDFNQLTAWIAIYLDTDSDKDYDDWVTDYLAGNGKAFYIQAEPYFTTGYPILNTWEMQDAFGSTPLKWVGLESPDYPSEAPTLSDYINGDAVSFPTTYHGVQSFASREYGSLYICSIKIRVGYGGPWANVLAYVDDITIDDYFENFGVDTSALLDDLKTEIDALSDDDGVDLKKPAMIRKETLIGKVNNVIELVEAEKYKAAIIKLEEDLKPKLDYTTKQTWAAQELDLLWKIDALINALSE